MADYNSSLPVRTETAGDVEIKVVDGTITSRKLTVNSDGSINTNTTLSATDLDIRDLVFATDKVDVSGSEVALDAASLAALENITVSATDLDIRDLAFATDSVDVSGSSVTVSATDLDVRDLAFATDSVDVSGSSVTVSATDLDVRDLAFATDSVDVSGSEVSLSAATLAALESVTVSATDLDIRDLTHASDSIKVGDGTDFLAVNTDGSINVNIVDASPGTAINDYNTVASVAAGASSTHTYTSTGNFYLNQIEAAGSGKMKIEVQVNGVTKFVQFNSTANTNMSVHIDNPILATSTQTVTVIRTNLDKQAQDLYSTVSGYNA